MDNHYNSDGKDSDSYLYSHMFDDEDTADASETDRAEQEEEYTEIKEQMYQDKLSNLKRQLQMLHSGNHPDYIKGSKRLEEDYERHRLHMLAWKDVETERVERDHVMERQTAIKEFEIQKAELRENLIADLEEKKKLLEVEKTNMELDSVALEARPTITRKLRRRPNDPLPVTDKRRRVVPPLIDYLLDDNDIIEDLELINENRILSPKRKQIPENNYDGSGSEEDESATQVRIEDGKLYYDKKWFHRGQQVYYEGKEVGNKNSGVINTINFSE
ncbi:sin3 histone deacetylase corepressor complex component SDS3, partial [Caerostris extrusa]